jgi:hypothetical protein
MAKKVLASRSDIPADTTVICPACGAKNMRAEGLCVKCDAPLPVTKELPEVKKTGFERRTEHRKIAVIPKATVFKVGMLNTAAIDYSILLTDQYTIFVQERKASDIAGFLGGSIGAMVARAVADKKCLDYDKVRVEELIQNVDNITIPHSGIRGIKMEKKLDGYFHLIVDYGIGSDFKERLSVKLVPPDERMKAAKSEGVDKRTVIEDYARKVKEAFEKALPPSAAQHATWGL